jgi:GDP-L-fucose synthase
MVGRAICRELERYSNIELITRTHQKLDLTDPLAVDAFMQAARPHQVYLAAARVGGIFANNTYPADFIHENLAIQTHVIQSAYRANVRRLLFLGSSCIYPRAAPQPITEDALLTGPLEPTNEPYAVAKIAGIKLCESFNRQHGTDFRSVMPTNLYGPGDNYHPENSHVIPGLIRRFHEASAARLDYVDVWGSGKPRREFLHVDDLASACVHIMGLDLAIHSKQTQPMLSHINVGTGDDIPIADLAQLVAKVVGYHGELRFDTSRPDGTPRKQLDVSKLKALGWQAKIKLEEGLESAYSAFLAGDGTNL